MLSADTAQSAANDSLKGVDSKFDSIMFAAAKAVRTNKAASARSFTTWINSDDIIPLFCLPVTKDLVLLGTAGVMSECVEALSWSTPKLQRQ